MKNGTQAAVGNVWGQRRYAVYPNGIQGDAEYISLTGDFELDGYGRPYGMDRTHQRVLVLVSTIKGSAADRTLGRDPFPLLNTPGARAKCESILRDALKPLIEAQLIKIISVTIEKNEQRMMVNLKWRDLEKQKDFIHRI